MHGGMYEVEFGEDGYIRKISPAALRFIGYSEEEAKGLTVMDVVAPESLEFLMQRYEQMPDFRPGETFEIYVKTKSGSLLKVRVEIIPIMREGELECIKVRVFPI